MRSKIIGFLKYALGLGLLAWVIATNWETEDGTGGLSSLIRNPIHFGPLVLAMLICAASVILTFLRWYLLVRVQSLPFTVRQSVQLGLVGYFFNTFLPGAVGGDLVKAVAIAREQSRRTVAVATVIADRVIGLWGLVWLVALLGLYLRLTDAPILSQYEYLAWIVRVSHWIIGISLSAWLIMGLLPTRLASRFGSWLHTMPRIGGLLSELWAAVWLYRNGANRAVFAAVVMSMISHAGFVLTFHFAVQVFAPSPTMVGSPAEHFLIVPVGVLAQAVFPSPGGVGGAEFVIKELYKEVLRKPVEVGLGGMLTFRAITWLLGIIGYLVYLVMRANRAIPKEIPEELPVSTDPSPLPEPMNDNGNISSNRTPSYPTGEGKQG